MSDTADQISPAYAFLRNPSMVDFPGHLAGVFFVAGCNFRCGFCHNAELLGRPRPGLPWARLEEACRRFRDNWVTGAVITGGEPTLSPDLPALVDFFRERGFAVKLDTNGSRPTALPPLLPLLESVAMDVKCSLPRYPELTGWKDTEAIAESVRLLKSWGRCEFRTTVIGPVHSDDDMHEIGRLLEGAPLYALQPFIPRDNLPDPALRTVPATPASRLAELRDLMAGYVARVVVRGTA